MARFEAGLARDDVPGRLHRRAGDGSMKQTSARRPPLPRLLAFDVSAGAEPLAQSAEGRGGPQRFSSAGAEEVRHESASGSSHHNFTLTLTPLTASRRCPAQLAFACCCPGVTRVF